MKKYLIFIFTLFLFNNAFSLSDKIIEVTEIRKTDDSIKITGKASIFPEGTSIKAEVKSINGKKLTDDIIIATPDAFLVGSEGKFEASLKKYGSLDGYNFPPGNYVVEFYASFNRAWQSVEVAKKLGVKLDSEGRSDLGEPHALPRSDDLVKDPFGVRMLKAQRAVSLKDAETKFSKYKTRKASLVVFGNGTLEKPAISISDNDLLAIKNAKKLANKIPGQAISLMCRGGFSNGYNLISTDLYYSSGRKNSIFSLNNGTTIIELCYQYEKNLLDKNRWRN